MPAVDRALIAERIERDVETLAGSSYTLSDTAIKRYAYTDVYRNTLDYFEQELEAVGFHVEEDCVGNFIARNRPRGESVFGLGSHCDSNRNGGKYDGTLGVVTALEVCRLNHELELGLPLQLISFLEEESSGFGVPMLGSRVMAQEISEEELRSARSIDDGRSFWEHAAEAGYEPDRWRESIEHLADLIGWIELHIEQGRVLQDSAIQIGLVTAIVGIVWADITARGRADHAGGTPMDLRADACLAAAECALAIEDIARTAGPGTVATVGEFEIEPGIVNVVPGDARISLDARSVDPAILDSILADVASSAQEVAEQRGLSIEVAERARLEPTPMDPGILDALAAVAEEADVRYLRLPSGGGHDTQRVAKHVPSAMIFVPCKDGISHSPLEEANPADAAVAAEVILGAIARLT